MSNRFFLYCLILSVIGGGLSISRIYAQKKIPVQWQTFQQLDSLLSSKSTAQDHALSEDKNILLYFYTSWCVYCRKMEADVFTDAEVKSLMSNFHSVKFNAESRDTVLFDGAIFTKKDKDQFHYLASILGNRDGKMIFPTIVLLDPEFRVISKSHQYLSRRQLKTFLSNALN